MVGLTLGQQGAEFSVSEYNFDNISKTKILSESQFLSLRESLLRQVSVPKQEYLCRFRASECRFYWSRGRAYPLCGSLILLTPWAPL